MSTDVETSNQPTLQEILDNIRLLGEDEKWEVYNPLREALFPNILTSAALIADLKEKRFHKGLNCPHCGSENVQRRGPYKDLHKYTCKACKRSFNDMTGTPTAGTHKLEKWRDYTEYMIKGVLLRKISEELEIATSTAFTWRHKVLNALRKVHVDGFKGVLEVDETCLLHSEKGSRDLGGRKPRKRGGKSKKRGISSDQDCILVARDRRGRHSLSSPVSAESRCVRQ
jgi:transposase-like protein